MSETMVSGVRARELERLRDLYDVLFVRPIVLRRHQVKPRHAAPAVFAIASVDGNRHASSSEIDADVRILDLYLSSHLFCNSYVSSYSVLAVGNLSACW